MGFIVALQLSGVLVDVTNTLPPGPKPDVIAVVFKQGKNKAIHNITLEIAIRIKYGETIGGGPYPQKTVLIEQQGRYFTFPAGVGQHDPGNSFQETESALLLMKHIYSRSSCTYYQNMIISCNGGYQIIAEAILLPGQQNTELLGKQVQVNQLMAFCTYPKNSGSINKQGVDDVIGNAVGSPSQIGVRSEERRVGKECRCRWWT